MIQILVPNIYNSKRTRKEELKANRKSIKDSNGAIARKKLFKVKHIEDEKLYENSTNPNGHYVLTVGINPNTSEVAVAQLNSIEGREGRPTKQDRIEKKFILPIPPNKITNNTRLNGVSIDLYIKNTENNESLKYNDLEAPYNEITIAKDFQSTIAGHIFNNPEHQKTSKRNKRVTKDMIKIK